jgi:hypothetical protein
LRHECRLCACSCQKCKIGARPLQRETATELGNVFHIRLEQQPEQDRVVPPQSLGKGSILISFPMPQAD